MKKQLTKLAVSAFVAVSGLTAPAVMADSFPDSSSSDEGKWYLTGSAGYGDLKDSGYDYAGNDTNGLAGVLYTGNFAYDSEFSFEAGLGYDFANRFRLEATYFQAEGSLASRTIDQASGVTITGTGAVDLKGVFANATWDITRDTWMTPYIGAGLGVVTVDTTAGTIAGSAVAAGSDSNLGYQLKVGADVPVEALNSDLFAEASYFGVGSVAIDGVNYSGANGFGIKGGLRWKF